MKNLKKNRRNRETQRRECRTKEMVKNKKMVKTK